MTDMFFPQLGIHIEVDEGFHKKQLDADRLREADIINATGHTIYRVDVTKDVDSINTDIDDIVSNLRNKIAAIQDFKEWDMEAETNPQTYIEKGYIDVDDNVAFKTMVDAANCFGLNIKPKGIWTGGAKHGVEPNTLVWFPKLYQNKDWNNQMSDDGEVITEMSEDPVSVRIHIDRVRKEREFTRIVFPRFKGPLGDYMYRFTGKYELDNDATGYDTGFVWRRVATRVPTYKAENSAISSSVDVGRLRIERAVTFESTTSVHAVWADDGSSYVYEAVPESVDGNDQSRSIRFNLREIDGQDSDLQVVIQQKSDGSHVFKTDYYEDPEREYPVKQFVAGDELLFYFEGKEGLAYFHLKSE
jgi:hypothetical protein